MGGKRVPVVRKNEASDSRKSLRDPSSVMPFEAASIKLARFGPERFEKLLSKLNLPGLPGLLREPHPRIVQELAGQRFTSLCVNECRA
jgi:hypothetical protein